MNQALSDMGLLNTCTERRHACSSREQSVSRNRGGYRHSASCCVPLRQSLDEISPIWSSTQDHNHIRVFLPSDSLVYHSHAHQPVQFPSFLEPNPSTSSSHPHHPGSCILGISCARTPILATPQADVPSTTSPVVLFPGATASLPSSFCFSHCSGV